jgi:hypothetical protein
VFLCSLLSEPECSTTDREILEVFRSPAHIEQRLTRPILTKIAAGFDSFDEDSKKQMKTFSQARGIKRSLL